MKDYNYKADENAKTLENEILDLSSGHWSLFERQYKEFWQHAREISNLFKTLKPLKKEDRQALWERFSSVCEETKYQQKSEHEERKRKSSQHRDYIIREAESARPHTLLGFAPPDVEDMKALGNVLKRASSMLSENKKEMFGEHKQECYERIKEIRHIHDLWWDDLKKHRSEKHKNFQERVRANLEKNYERLRKATDALQRQRSHADKLRDDIDSAWNDDFRDRAYGWLSETEDKIRDIEQSIENIEDWIREDEEKLR